MNRNIVIGGVVVAVIAVVGYQMGAAGGGGAALEPIAMDGLDDPETLVDLASGVTLGDENAPITIVEFGDYQCPGCMGFNQSVKPQIDLSYIQTGQAQFIYYDYPLINAHPWAFLAARAARCAGDQDMYWEYHDALFANQPRWSPSALPPTGDFEDYADQVGLNGGQFSSCLRSDMHADVVTANMTLAMQLQLGGTPAIMVSIEGGQARRVAENSYRGIQAAIDELQASMTPAGGSN